MDSTGEQLVYDPSTYSAYDSLFWQHICRYLHARDCAREMGSRGLMVLDAACGSGYGTYLISRDGHHCAGVDLHDDPVRFAKHLYDRPNCTFGRADVASLPFHPQTFDLVLSFETVEHLTQDQQERFLSEIARVLKRSGRLIMSTPVSEGTETLNPFHLKELLPHEFIGLVQRYLPRVRTFGQCELPPNQGGNTPDTGSTLGGTPPACRSRRRVFTARAARSRARALAMVVKRLASSCAGRHYLEHPWLLDAVASSLHRYYMIRPASEGRRFGFLIVQAEPV
jgi:ubiquinone/menaquinone biosynthesis C-methylase UbiE